MQTADLVVIPTQIVGFYNKACIMMRKRKVVIPTQIVGFYNKYK